MEQLSCCSSDCRRDRWRRCNLRNVAHYRLGGGDERDEQSGCWGSIDWFLGDEEDHHTRSRPIRRGLLRSRSTWSLLPTKHPPRSRLQWSKPRVRVLFRCGPRRLQLRGCKPEVRIFFSCFSNPETADTIFVILNTPRPRSFLSLGLQIWSWPICEVLT